MSDSTAVDNQLTAPLLSDAPRESSNGDAFAALEQRHHFFATAKVQGWHLVKMAFPIVYVPSPLLSSACSCATVR